MGTVLLRSRLARRFHRTNVIRNSKGLDLVELGGPSETILRTFSREVALLAPSRILKGAANLAQSESESVGQRHNR